MREKLGCERDSIALRITNKLERYTFRSTTQVVVHVLVSIIIATVIYLLLRNTVGVPETYFVTITSSMSAASGALLAVTIALAGYYSLPAMNWRDKLVDELARASLRTRKQMEKSAKQHPEISRQLAPLYEKSLLYVPGKPINKTEINEIAKSFLIWAKKQAESKPRKLDAGNVAEYDSFEMHLRDALVCEHQISHNLILLDIVRNRIQTIGTFSFLTVGWAAVFVLTLTFAILGSSGVIPENVGLPLLAIPFWLFLVGGFALLKDITAVFAGFQFQEIGFDEALAELNTKQ